VEERVDRLESLAAIRQLPSRYALCVDSRDVDTMVSLFVPDVRVGRDASGRDPLRAWFVKSLSRLADTVHFAGNHVVDFDDADHAHGIVTCHDEVVFRKIDGWHQGMLQYWDTYRRVEGPDGREWCFERRRFTRWYMSDWLERPSHGANPESQEARPRIQLPEAFDTWAAFWAEVGEDPYPA
jgi:hypothetical protein